MPLIVISGFPASGKTTRANELKRYFESRNKKVHIITENEAVPKAGFQKNKYFENSQFEKQVRSDLKSEALRLLNKEDVVILDAGNYIKGYRYELFCATKSVRTTQCTLFCGIQNERGWEFNLKRNGIEPEDWTSVTDETALNNSNIAYTREIYDALCMRYEEPHSNCRWDSPLFVVFPEDELEFSNIYAALYETKPLPPNQSTQNPPLSSSNYLYDLDRITQQIVVDILAARKIGVLGDVPVKGSDVKVSIPHNLNAMQLNRLKRQFINFTKLHHATTSTLDKIPQLFVQFLNSNFNQ